MAELYGGAVLQAPYLKAANAAADDVSKFVDSLERASQAQSRFTVAADKSARAFQHVGVSVKSTLEGFARVALSPLQILFPAGLAVGLFGLGAGLAGVGTLYGLERASAGVTDRRRRALSLGVDYGAVSAFDLNFARFGAQGALQSAAAASYDFTSPAFMGFRGAGAARGSADESAIALMRSIPTLLQGVPDAMVGPVARSRNLTSILDLPTILRLRAHPEEVEDQVKRFREDRQKFEIPPEAAERWASFNAALERAGQNIESSLGRTLVGLTPGLTKFSDDVVGFIDAFVDSGAMTEALKGIEGGLRWLEASIGSSEFKHGAREFLRGLETLGPYVARFVDVAGRGIYYAGRGAYYGAKLAGDDSYNPTLGGLIGDVGGIKGQDAPVGAASNRLPSIRYYAGHGSARPLYPSGVVDESTGKLTTSPGFRYSPRLCAQGAGSVRGQERERQHRSARGHGPGQGLSEHRDHHPPRTGRETAHLHLRHRGWRPRFGADRRV